MQVSNKPILPAEAFNFHGCRPCTQRISEVSQGKKKLALTLNQTASYLIYEEIY